jgi:ribosomal protein S18 acetylase RimI-like enzyme
VTDAVEMRPATWDDAGALLPLIRDYYAEESYPFDAQASRDALRGLLVDPAKGRAWVVIRDDRVVGYVVLTLGWSLEYRGLDAFVDELFVTPADRGRGLGRKLLEALLQACRELGVKALHLEVEQDKPEASALYRKLGFEDHERRLMTLAITPSAGDTPRPAR